MSQDYDNNATLHITTGTNHEATVNAVQNPCIEPRAIPWIGYRKSPDGLYIFRCQEFCKIGITKNVFGRMNALECVNPFEIEIALYVGVKEARALEKEAHIRLKDKRHRKEWFRCTAEEAVAVVKSIAEERGYVLTPREKEDNPYR